MASKRIGKNVGPYFHKAKDSALLAVEVYNKPAVKFKSEGYIALMVMAWTALLHAVFLRRGKNPYQKANGRYIKVDGDFKHWELGECAKQFWGGDTANPVRSAQEFGVLHPAEEQDRAPACTAIGRSNLRWVPGTAAEL